MRWDDKPAVSFAWILTTFILCFPVGIVLLLIRIGKHRHLSFQKTEDLKVGAYVLISFFAFFFIIVTILLISDDTMSKQAMAISIALLGLMFLGPAVSMLARRKLRLKQLDERYFDYNTLITEHRITSIDELAQRVQLQRKTVINDLQRMIYLGYFDGHVGEQYIVLQNQPNADFVTQEMFEFNQTVTFEQPPLAPKSVECSGCGSRSTVQPGTTTECDYCGTSLVYPA